jgi:hypothetical protein
MIPRGFDVRDSLPTMPNGKTDRVALAKSAPAVLTRGASSSIGRARLSPTAISEPGLVHPRDSEPSAADEATVIAVWSTVLGRTIERDDNFFEVGGHSLLAVKVFRLLGERSAVPLALTDIFRFPNARLLGAHLASLRPGAGATNATPSNATPLDTPAPTATAGDDRGARRRNALLGRGRGS